MKVNAFVAAGVGSLILASVASADIIVTPPNEWSHEIKGTTTKVGDGFWAVNIYVDFTSADDRLLSVIGADYGSLGDQLLWQDPLNPGGVEPAAAFVDLFPDLAHTSFVTIGHKETVLGEPLTALDPDGAWGPSGFTGGYFVPGDAPQGLAGPSLKVLIAQLTIQNPNASAGVGGTATVAWKAAGGETTFTEIAFEVFIPGPGALALLGLAGLTGTRRRR